MMDERKLLERITVNPKIFGGKSIIRDRPLSVEQVLGMLADGDTIETLLENYPWLEKEDIQACLLYAQRLVSRERPKLTIAGLKESMPEVLEQAPYIKLLVLFGSRARGDADENSDWDFAVLFDEEQRKLYEKAGWDSFRVWSILQKTYNLLDDQIDVVDMGRCSDILAHYIAQDGQILFERELGTFEMFKQKKLKTPEEMKRIQKELRDEIDRKLQEFQQ